MLLALLAAGAVVVLAVMQFAMHPAPAASGSYTATLMIDFGSRTPDLLAGHIVNWSYDGGWHYTTANSSQTEFIFSNVTFGNNTVWSLMQACSSILQKTTGSNLSLTKVHFREFGEFQITAIEGVANTNTLFWQYTVNGQPAQYGVQLEKISSGATVYWSMSPDQ